MLDSNPRRAARKVARLTPGDLLKAHGRGRYPDGGGLYLQVSAFGTWSWVFRYEVAGRERLMGLGAALAENLGQAKASLAAARAAAANCRNHLVAGDDPIEVRKSKRIAHRIEAAKGMTFEQCAAAYIKAHKPGWKNAKHADQWGSTLATYAYPIFGNLPVAAIDTALILKAIEPIWNTKTETANRVRGRIETVLDWARARGYRDGDNPARWRSHLDQLLPRKSRVAPVKHRPALPYLDIPEFIAELHKRNSTSALALEFLILTATRTGEVIYARRGEVDAGARLWTVPKERTKSGREHRVPLSARALEILESLLSWDDDADVFIFPGARGNKPLSNMALLELLRGMDQGNIVVHGFRSTFKDWAAETTMHENIVTEMALAHKVSDDVEAAYRRGDLFGKRRKLADDWASYCMGDQSGEGKVLPLRRRRRTL